MSQANALGARICQGTFFFIIGNHKEFPITRKKAAAQLLPPRRTHITAYPDAQRADLYSSPIRFRNYFTNSFTFAALPILDLR